MRPAIVETSSGQLFRILSDNPATPQAWTGIEVKRCKAGFQDKKNARIILVRKAASRIIAEVA